MNLWTRFLDWMCDKPAVQAALLVPSAPTFEVVERSLLEMKDEADAAMAEAKALMGFGLQQFEFPPTPHPGPPPSVGWWPTGGAGDGWLRWWNGQAWSLTAQEWMSAEVAARRAEIVDSSFSAQTHTVWRARPASWPERSRT